MGRHCPSVFNWGNGGQATTRGVPGRLQTPHREGKLLNFGKYCQVDVGYLQWMHHNFTELSPLLKAEVIMRGKMNYKESEKMICEDVHTLVTDLKVCSMRRDLQWGRKLHVKAMESGNECSIYVVTALIRMYAKCGSVSEACRVFDSIQNPDVVCWNVLLWGHVENGEGFATLELFSRMKSSGYIPSSVTYIAALKACMCLRDGNGQGEWLERGKQIHVEISCHLSITLQNTLVDMYGKGGIMTEARSVFDNIQRPTVVSWTALLLGYAENGEGLAALELFSKMKASGCTPNCVTYIAVLKACSLVGALALGRKFHSEITEFTAYLVSCLVDFYSNCGSIVEAHEVFDRQSKARNISTWTALLTGYGTVGDTATVFKLFGAMQDEGFRPDAVTFVCMLSCCSHAGLVEKAREYFKAMPLQYGVSPSVMHYTCMVDVLGRANLLNEAIDMLRVMPCNPNAVTWMTLMGACRTWKNVEIGRCAFDALVDMDKKYMRAYVLMGQIYGSVGMWEEQKGVLEQRGKLGSACKLTEQTYVYDEVGNMVKFVVGEEDSPAIKNKFEELLLKESGYIVEYYKMSYDVDNEGIMCGCGHSERRGVVYGLLRAAASDEPVRAFKNMRMCDDCHEATKMISKLYGRVIMVRDSTKFHVMMNDSCSCGEYW